MDESLIISFGWMVLAATLASIVAAKVKLPPAVALLIAGMIIGPSVLHLINIETTEMFAEVGAALLLFMIGIEFSIPKLLSTGLKAVISSLLLVLITFIGMHEIALLLGFGGIAALFVAAMFSMSSTALIMRILEQKGLVEREEVPVLVGMLVIEDIIAVFMLAMFSGLKAGSITPESIIGAIFTAFAILGFSYIILLKVLKHVSEYGLIGSTEDVRVLFAVALGFGMSALAGFLGVTPAIGAFLAGSLMSALPESLDLEKSVRPFGLVFSALFFLSVGMFISPLVIAGSWVSILILLLAFMALVFLGTLLIIYLQTSNGHSAVFAGLAMLPLGEFSLLIAKASVGVVPENNLVGIAALGVLVSSLICSFFLSYNEKMYLWLRQHSPIRVVSTLTHASRYFRNVIASFEPGGYFHRLFLFELNRVISDVLFIFAAGLFYWLARITFTMPLTIFGTMIQLDNVIFFLAILLSLIPLSRIFVSVKRLFDALSTIFSRTTPQSSKSSVVKNLLIAIVLFFLFANFYLIVAFLHLPSIFNWISVVFGLMCVFFLWSSIRTLSLGFFLSEGKMGPLLHEKIMAGSEDMVQVVTRRRHKDPDEKEKRTKGEEKKEKGDKSSKTTAEDDEVEVAKDIEGRDLDESE